MRCSGRNATGRGCAAPRPCLGQVSLLKRTGQASQTHAPHSTVKASPRDGAQVLRATGARSTTKKPSFWESHAQLLSCCLPGTARRPKAATLVVHRRSDTHSKTSPHQSRSKATATRAAAPPRQPPTTSTHSRMALRDPHKTACAAPRKRAAPRRALAHWKKEFWDAQRSECKSHSRWKSWRWVQVICGWQAAVAGTCRRSLVAAALACRLRRQAHPVTLVPSAHHRPKPFIPKPAG